MNLLSMFLKLLLAKEGLSAVAEKTGISKDVIKKVLPLAIPLLIRYMTRNASSEKGASSLRNALSQHKNERSISEQIREADTNDGEKIIGHILGKDEEDVVKNISKQSGVDTADVLKLLCVIAPALLSGLSAAHQSASQQPAAAQSADFSGLLGMFGGHQEVQQQETSHSGLGLLGSLLGGNSNNTASSGNNLLGSLMGLAGASAQNEKEEKESAIDGSDLLNLLTLIAKK